MMERLSAKLIGGSLARAQIKPHVEASQILEYCTAQLVKMFGGSVMKKVKPLSCIDGTVKIAVLSSVLAGEIRLREYQLIKKINRHYGQEKVKNILLEL